MTTTVVADKDTVPETPSRRISWAAVIAGVVVAMAAQLLLSLLGVGVGASAFDPINKDNPAAGLGTGAVVWLALSAVLSLAAGGWTAARLASVERAEGVMHGVLTWSLATLLSFGLLTTTVGAVIGGAARGLGQAANLLGQTAAAAGPSVAAAAPGVADAVGDAVKDSGFDWESVKREVRTVLRQTGKPALDPGAVEAKGKDAKEDAKNAAANAAKDPLAGDEELRTLLSRLYGRFRETADAADREALVNLVAARTGKPKAEAEQIVAGWEKSYETAKKKFEEVKAKAEEKAREAANNAAIGVRRFAYFSFAGLLFGLGAAAAGGLLGSRDPKPVVVVATATTPPKKV